MLRFKQFLMEDSNPSNVISEFPLITLILCSVARSTPLLSPEDSLLLHPRNLSCFLSLRGIPLTFFPLEVALNTHQNILSSLAEIDMDEDGQITRSGICVLHPESRCLAWAGSLGHPGRFIPHPSTYTLQNLVVYRKSIWFLGFSFPFLSRFCSPM